MDRLTYIFNPDHDLALASASDHFDAPLSAKRFAQECALLPLWYAESNSTIFSSTNFAEWFKELQQSFPQFSQTDISSSIAQSESFFPWGWNLTLRRNLEKRGCSVLPSKEDIEKIRELSHRRNAIAACTYVHEHANTHIGMVSPATAIQKNEIRDFCHEHPYAIFKAPWSGSGKGIVRILGEVPDNLYNRVCNIIQKQGCIIAEPLYTRIQDFAMEFTCENGMTRFAGYSWFYTDEHGAYLGNLLATDDAIERRLSQWLSIEDIHTIRTCLMAFIQETMAPYYNGVLGVDMFILDDTGTYRIHPCVEINMRMTMGMLARKLYDRFVSQEKEGVFLMHYFTDSLELTNYYLKQRNTYPCHIENGRITKGYKELIPITESSHYLADCRIE